MIKIRKTAEFAAWYAGLRLKEQAQIEARLFRIEVHAHFGDAKMIHSSTGSLCELRWSNGWRVYFYRDGEASITLLLGGKKNDQKKDIKKAEVLLQRYAHVEKQKK